ncbi:MAG: hypothetical protein K0U36_03040, partial [Alphaproteobacteria bacterium]|nr:hypothetical protein [Alphaproteobacteria bacterium]
MAKISLVSINPNKAAKVTKRVIRNKPVNPASMGWFTALVALAACSDNAVTTHTSVPSVGIAGGGGGGTPPPIDTREPRQLQNVAFLSDDQFDELQEQAVDLGMVSIGSAEEFDLSQLLLQVAETSNVDLSDVNQSTLSVAHAPRGTFVALANDTVYTQAETGAHDWLFEATTYSGETLYFHLMVQQQHAVATENPDSIGQPADRNDGPSGTVLDDDRDDDDDDHDDDDRDDDDEDADHNPDLVVYDPTGKDWHNRPVADEASKNLIVEGAVMEGYIQEGVQEETWDMTLEQGAYRIFLSPGEIDSYSYLVDTGPSYSYGGISTADINFVECFVSGWRDWTPESLSVAGDGVESQGGDWFYTETNEPTDIWGSSGKHGVFIDIQVTADGDYSLSMRSQVPYYYDVFGSHFDDTPFIPTVDGSEWSGVDEDFNFPFTIDDALERGTAETYSTVTFGQGHTSSYADDGSSYAYVDGYESEFTPSTSFVIDPVIDPWPYDPIFVTWPEPVPGPWLFLPSDMPGQHYEVLVQRLGDTAAITEETYQDNRNLEHGASTTGYISEEAYPVYHYDTTLGYSVPEAPQDNAFDIEGKARYAEIYGENGGGNFRIEAISGDFYRLDADLDEGDVVEIMVADIQSFAYDAHYLTLFGSVLTEQTGPSRISGTSPVIPHYVVDLETYNANSFVIDVGKDGDLWAHIAGANFSSYEIGFRYHRDVEYVDAGTLIAGTTFEVGDIFDAAMSIEELHLVSDVEGLHLVGSTLHITNLAPGGRQEFVFEGKTVDGVELHATVDAYVNAVPVWENPETGWTITRGEQFSIQLAAAIDEEAITYAVQDLDANGDIHFDAATQVLSGSYAGGASGLTVRYVASDGVHDLTRLIQLEVEPSTNEGGRIGEGGVIDLGSLAIGTKKSFSPSALVKEAAEVAGIDLSTVDFETLRVTRMEGYENSYFATGSGADHVIHLFGNGVEGIDTWFLKASTLSGENVFFSVELEGRFQSLPPIGGPITLPFPIEITPLPIFPIDPGWEIPPLPIVPEEDPARFFNHFTAQSSHGHTSRAVFEGAVYIDVVATLDSTQEDDVNLDIYSWGQVEDARGAQIGSVDLDVSDAFSVAGNTVKWKLVFDGDHLDDIFELYGGNNASRDDIVNT